MKKSHLILAHSYWEKLLQPGDWVIDATCGNGHDTLFLSQLIQGNGGVIALDVQERALEQTRLRLPSNAPVHLFLQSHEQFPSLALDHPIRLIVYNLGYLPGSQNKQQTTQTSSTLTSVKQALSLIQPGGAISITCYPGHEEGQREQNALFALTSELPFSEWNVLNHQCLNRTLAPSLLLIERNKFTK